MRVIHVISGISRSSGGPARSSQGLVSALNAAGVEAWLVSCAVGERPLLLEFMHDGRLESLPETARTLNAWVRKLEDGAKLV